MFGSPNPFGQPSTSPFVSQPVFGQTANASNNPFAPKPFGSTSPFGSQTGNTVFGGTSTGVFGAAQSSSPFPSNTTFGGSSSPAFGATPSTFGASSTPAFGSSSSSSFGGSSIFGQKPLFGGFGSTPTQTNPFGNTNQQSQPAFGSNVFGSTSPFGAPSQSAFGATSTPAFGATSTPAFGATSTPAFGAASTPAFGATSTPAFGATSTPAFGATSTPAFGAASTPAFGATSTPAFGSTSTPAFGSTGNAFGSISTPVFGSGGGFGASSTPAFGASSTPAFGASSAPAFGASSAPAFGASSTPSFSFGSTPAFGQSTSAFGSSTFGTNTSPFGAQTSPFGAQSTSAFGTSGFGQAGFGGQRGGSRVAAYTPTTEPDAGSGSSQAAGKLESISAMPVYKDKSHEELRWEDYQSGDKGGPLPAGQSASSGVGFGVSNAQPNPLASSTFNQSSSPNPFSTATSTNPFAPKSSGFGAFGPSTTFSFNSSAFAPSSSSNPFASTTAASTSSFLPSTTSQFGSSSLFSSSNAQPLASQSAFSSTTSPGTNLTFPSSLNFSNTQTSSLFQSTTPSIGQTGSAFGAPFSQSSLFRQPSSGVGGNLFSSSPSLLTSSNPMGFGQTSGSFSMPFQPAQAQAQAPTSFFSNLGQAQPIGSSGFAGTSSMFGQNNFGQSPITQSPAVQPAPATNPFGTLPAMPHMSISRPGAAPSIQYGISSMPVVDKAAPVRISTFLTPRHLSNRRMRLPVRKYNPKNDGSPRVPFFSDDEETPSTPKADALFIPRENPRALVIRPTDQWPSRASLEKALPSKDTSVRENGKIAEDASSSAVNNSKDTNGNVVENGTCKDNIHVNKVNQKPNGVHEDHPASKEDCYRTFGGYRAGEAAIVYEHGADIEALMPKLRHSDYYTEPKIQELAAKERAEPGFCRRVTDFVVGRHGYGSIKFFGETDVRRLDLESIVQFNNREVIVYLDESKKPPCGQGLNKPAEVTILNIKCIDKQSGNQYTEGPKVEKYKELLRKKTEGQGATFISHDSVKGEWKFRVEHFSRYNMEEVEDWE
ncbi:nuclear pore complex protein NUP98A-like [Cucurbita pepo subsp. pepo]|uniref:nuclear pore complex protein NUP98A-like n=1 Tax=Cucurbita pepo subsp. pepo TaxID=3664 RepID=UPI000C9D2EDB|nr:nuclear pore complex protein NUP98A-like [Cucurbita pepo subsp. pepo]XP_023512470.1 nuclear pore complex protein NUP98A-like [Cucurbita pepo subsp. pepo]